MNMMNMKSVTQGRSRRSSAFTLVELLVVVSIIALLIAILLPSLKKARQAAKRVACNANLRSVAQAGLTYAVDDPQELAIPIGKGDGPQVTDRLYPSYIGFGGKSGQGTQLSNPFDGVFSLDSKNRPLNYVLYKGGFGGKSIRQIGRVTKTVYDADLEMDVFRCPGDKGFPGMHHQGWKDSGLTAYDFYGTAFAANPLYIGRPNEKLSSNAIYLRPMSRVPSPSDTVLYWEYAARYATFMTNTEEYDQTGCNGYWPHPIAQKAPANGHHGQPWHFNVSFGDGHSAWIKIKGHGRVRDSRIADKWRCVVVRGLGWRIDTLPAQPIETPKMWIDGTGSQNDKDGRDGTIFEIAAK